MRLGSVLKCYRLMKDLTLRELADEIDLSHSTLHRIERGHNPEGDSLMKIFNWLCTSPALEGQAIAAANFFEE